MKTPTELKKKSALKPLNAMVDAELFEGFREVSILRDEFLRDAIHWSLQAYILTFSPKVAKRLNIKAK